MSFSNKLINYTNRKLLRTPGYIYNDFVMQYKYMDKTIQ